MPLKAPKGTRDILPADSARWHSLEAEARRLCRDFGYHEIRTPLFEHTDLFSRGVGETTDIVQKEMYTFNDKAGRSLTLRPEGTAGVARAYIENGMASLPAPLKMYYYGPMYRYENVQHGRYREFWQFGCEVVGSAGPGADVELISLLNMFFTRLGLPKTDLRINSIGCPSCRPRYHELLKAYLSERLDKLCGDCRERFQRNPLRALDCKNEKCRAELSGAPLALDHICNDCAGHFDGVKSGLADLGVSYGIDKTIVRGLDYYTRTVFEFISSNLTSLGATICGGGRYDGLIGLCGGQETPGVGFSVGVERLFLELDSYGAAVPEQAGVRFFIAAAGEGETARAARAHAAKLAHSLRAAGLSAETDLNGRSVRAQMKYADKRRAAYVVVIGDDELKSGEAVLRSMADGSATGVRLDRFVEHALSMG